MNISKDLDGLNRRIKRLKFEKCPPTLRMVTLQPWEVEEENNINDPFCLMVRIEEKDPDLFSSKL